MNTNTPAAAGAGSRRPWVAVDVDEVLALHREQPAVSLGYRPRVYRGLPLPGSRSRVPCG